MNIQGEENRMLVLEHTNPNPAFVVRYYGRELAATNNCQLDQGIMFGKQHGYCACVMAPCTPAYRFKCLPHAGDNSVVRSDAVILTSKGESVAFATSDCGAVILFEKMTRSAVLVHPGRNQLMDYSHPNERKTIIDGSVDALIKTGAAADSIQALIFGQIKPENFAHDNHPYKDLILAQANIWGEDIVPDKESVTLDLNRLIERQLQFYGATKKPMTLGPSNPYICPDLSSKRAGKTGSNLVVLNLK